MKQILLYVTLCFTLFSCKKSKTNTTKLEDSLVKKETIPVSSEWLFITNNFERIELDSVLLVDDRLSIIMKSTSGRFEGRIDSIIAKVTNEPILVNTSLDTNYDIRYTLHQSIRKKDIHLLLYSKSIWNSYKEIFLATYIENRMISKIMLSRYDRNNSEICCSIIHPNLLIEKCMSLDYGSSRFIVKSKHSIDASGEIKTLDTSSIGFSKDNLCNCHSHISK